ncbi:uncharacterized protein rbbp8l [Lampris incognitus]|uniref:uncharacterized protein rbbp8l n=1 Tax=Lampris incognitus TaxID=2546036 RepID=UPI0024B5DC37|nr:uncharacterized protein rbbp8l [Lampris incognitus]
MPASSMANAPPKSDWNETEMSRLDTEAVTVEPSLGGSLLSVDDWDDGSTASWVREQSSIAESSGSDHSPPPSVAASPASDDPATASGVILFSESSDSVTNSKGSSGITKAMEGFNELLHKLREVHEREVEVWQVKVQELSNKKGCDSKRMEELFSRNQQMREQHRLLTENIKTLENRLRAGLCDRCTVTQDVAERRQQEYETSQIKSFQHISILVGEVNNLTRENRRLREEVRNLKGALDTCQNERSSSSTTPEVKPSRSPDLSPPGGPMSLITTATSHTTGQAADGDVAMKTELDQRAEDSVDAMDEQRQMRGWNRSHFESYKPFSLTPSTSVSWRKEHVTQSGAGDKSIPHSSPSSSSSTPGDVNPSRHVLHAPVPCRPRPIKTGPWPLSEAADWVTQTNSTANSLVAQSNHKSSSLHFPTLASQQANHCSQTAQRRRQVLGQMWPRHSPLQSHPKEKVMVLRVRSLSEQEEGQARAPEKKAPWPTTTSSETPHAEGVFGVGLREENNAPLDLSDRGRSKSSQSPKGNKPLSVHGGERVAAIPGSPSSSSSSPLLPSCPSTLSSSLQQETGSGDHNLKSVEGQAEEPDGKTDQASEKVPVLTISLQPVVLLETLNSALQESSSSNGKLAPAADRGSSSEEPDGAGSGSSSECGPDAKRKKARLDISTDRDSDEIQQERKMKIKMEPWEKSPT